MLLKIFLTFWLAVALVAAGQEIASLIAQRDEQAALDDARRLVADAQFSVIESYARGGVAAARDAAADIERRRQATVDLLDRRQHSLFDRELRPAVVAAARRANELASQGSPYAAVNLGEHVAAKRVVTPAGEPLTLVVELPGHGVARAVSGWSLSPVVRYGAVLALGGVLCFLLARHISKPIAAITAAAQSLADGHLEARAGPRLAKRRDEAGRLARDFDRMAERIEALVEGQRRLLGDVSHELRSPLARLSVAAGLAQQQAPAAAGEYFDRIAIETTRLDRLIEQLLTLSRIESGVDDDRRERVNLTELVQEVVADGDFEAKAAGKRVTLARADSAADAVDVMDVVLDGRADLLRSGVENIVRNAIRYTPAGSAVEVSLRAEPARAALTIRDHGPGVPGGAVAEMFRRFRRIGHGYDGDGGAPDGAGLGLAIADSVVRWHGGTIGAVNADGGGLLVTIELPMP